MTKLLCVCIGFTSVLGLVAGEAQDEADLADPVAFAAIPEHFKPAFTDALPNPPVVASAPAGVWRPARIELAGWHGGLVLHGGFRAGVMPVAGRASARQKVGELRLDQAVLSGAWTQDGGKISLVGTLGGADGETVSGTWTCRRSGATQQGTLTGWIRDAARLAAAQAFPAAAAWPGYLGPGQAKAMPPGPRLVDRLDQARLLWRSELPIDRGPGNGAPFQRQGKYISMAFEAQTIAGGSTPVVAGGRVFTWHFVPSAQGPWRAEVVPLMRAEWAQRSGADGLKGDRSLGVPSGVDTELQGPAADLDGKDQDAHLPPMTEVPLHAREKYALFADEVVACHDAATGALRWSITFPRAGVGAPGQDHKTGPTNCTPCTDGRRVFATGTTGRVYAVDADTGALIWHARMPTSGYNRMHGGYLANFNQTPLLVGETLIVPDHHLTLYAYDAATGVRRWVLPGGSWPLAPLIAWRLAPGPGSADHVLALVDLHGLAQRKTRVPPAAQVLRHGDAPATARLMAVAVADGSVTWALDGPFSPKGITPAGMRIVLSAPPADGKEDAKTELICFDVADGRPQRRWAVRTDRLKGEFVPVAGDGRLWIGNEGGYAVHDVDSGRELARLDGPGPGNEGTAEFADGRLLTRIEGSHGDGPWTWARFADGRIELAQITVPAQAGRPSKIQPPGPPVTWVAQHPLTSSYHCQPMLFPVVDGRMFVRGTDGVYAYDLRAAR